MLSLESVEFGNIAWRLPGEVLAVRGSLRRDGAASGQTQPVLPEPQHRQQLSPIAKLTALLKTCKEGQNATQAVRSEEKKNRRNNAMNSKGGG